MKTARTSFSKPLKYVETAASFAVFSAAIMYYGQLMIHNLWRDESENILVARLMAHGDKLYRDIFSHHGPASFVLPFMLECLWPASVIGHRIVIAVLWAFAAYSLMTSNVIKESSYRRLHCLCALTIPFLYFQDAFLFAQTYQVCVGALMVPLLSRVIFPSILDDQSVSSQRFYLSGLYLGTLPFVAIYFLPIALLLSISCLSYRSLKPLASGWITSLVLFVSFIAAKGSFAGYYADTIYINYYILPEFISNLTLAMREKVTFCVLTSNFGAMLLSITLLSSMAKLGAKEKCRLPWRSVSTGLAIVTFTIRGDHCHSGPYVGSLMAATGLLFIDLPRRDLSSRLASFAVYLLLFAKLYQGISAPQGVAGKQDLAVDDYFTRAVAHFSGPQDTILAYPFYPDYYLQLNRRPASAYLVYFPWLARYAENPILNVHTNVIQDIQHNQPKFIYCEIPPNWFGAYDFSAPLRQELQRRYLKLGRFGFWVRDDLPVADIENFLDTPPP